MGQVIDVDVKCYEMTFLRKSDENGKIFALPSKYKHWVQEQSAEKLQVPTTDQRDKKYFCIPILKAE